MTTSESTDSVHSFEYCFYTAASRNAKFPTPHELIITNMMNSAHSQYSQFEVSMPLNASSANPTFSSLAKNLMTHSDASTSTTIPQAVTDLEKYYDNILNLLEVDNTQIAEGTQQILELRAKVAAKQSKTT